MIAPSPASFPVSEPLKWTWILPSSSLASSVAPLTSQYGATMWTTGIPFLAASCKANLKFLAPWPKDNTWCSHSQTAANLLYPISTTWLFWEYGTLTYSV